MLDFARHKGIRGLLKDSQAGPRAKVNPLATINGAGKTLNVLEFASTGSLCKRGLLIFIFHNRNFI